jgi:hypothetical protein
MSVSPFFSNIHLWSVYIYIYIYTYPFLLYPLPQKADIVNEPDPKWRRKSRIPDGGDPVIPFFAPTTYWFFFSWSVIWFDTIRYDTVVSSLYFTHWSFLCPTKPTPAKRLISSALAPCLWLSPKWKACAKYSQRCALFLPRCFILSLPLLCAFRSLSIP